MEVHLPLLVALNHSPHDTLNHKIGGEEGIVGIRHLRSAGIAPAFCQDCTLGTNCSVTETVRSGDDPHASGYHRGSATGYPERNHSFLETPVGAD